MQRLFGGGRPPQTIMTASSLGKGIVLLLLGSSSSFVARVRDPNILKLFIMSQSLSLCLMRHMWFGRASSRSLLKWSVGGRA
jgi:hypothetical protein